MPKKIAILGLGFVGLTTALGFAEKGFFVIGYDVNKVRLTGLAIGDIDFHEPYLREKLHKHLGQTFHLAETFEQAISESSVIFLCVGTPTGDNGAVDTSYLQSALRAALPLIRDRTVTFVVKSTVPPGTIRHEIMPIIADSNAGLASNPEFLREGVAWEDFMYPDRIVIGALDDRSFQAVAPLYAGFEAELLRVSLSTAEFIKSTSNAFLATLISFANECAIAAESVGDVDVRAAFAALHRDRRWSGNPAKMSSYFYPGCGFGGYCLPKDAAAFCAAVERAGGEMPMLRKTLSVNTEIKEQFAARIAALAHPGQPVGVLGLSFKPGSDDVRDTPAATIIRSILDKGCKVIAYDPLANAAFANAYSLPITYAASIAEVVAAGSPIAVLTAWPEFSTAKNLFDHLPVVDGRYYL
jgi:UDPglucose 6-dehydrogenase